ncbi:MAG: hypothetical protein PWR01_221 [Clostridiales bacterium]|nr:hypothetical protein [Clostridiales bacterium]
MNHKDYFDSIAHKWDEMVYHDPQKLLRFFEFIDLQPGQTVLDVGTGTGVLIPYIYNKVKNNGQIDAIDLSEAMLEQAKKKYTYPNINYIVGDVCALPMDVPRYDCIICYSVFPHFVNKDQAIKHMVKGLKKGGKLVVCHSESREKINSIHRRSEGIIKQDILPPAVVVAQMMKDAGMSIFKQIDDHEMYFVGGIKQLR